MSGLSSGVVSAPGSPTPAGRRTQPILSGAAGIKCSCKAWEEAEMLWNGSGVGDPVGKAAPSHGRSGAGPLLWDSCGAGAAGAQPRLPRDTQRLWVSVYLCCSEMVPCHWDRKQLWTEISAYDGNVSSVMLFHIFLKPGFLQTDIFTCLLYNIGMGFMKSPWN